MSGHGHASAAHDHGDDWHHHSAEEGSPQAAHSLVANAGLLVKAFVLITVAVVVVIMALVMYYRHFTTQLKATRIETDTLAATVRSQKSAWNNQLSSYGPIGDTPGVYAMPIENAMDLVVKKYGGAAAAPATGK